jgi:hypothetical protein
MPACTSPALPAVRFAGLIASSMGVAFLDSAAPEVSREPAPAKALVRWNAGSGSPARPFVEIAGLSAAVLEALGDPAWTPSRWQRLLPVYAGQGNVLAEVSLPPMLGTYRLARDRIVFEPKFTLEPGVTYRAVLHHGELPGAGTSTAVVSAEFRLPKRPVERTTVVSRVFPAAASVPENLLKFYIHFSAPMSGGHIYEHIQLREESGRAVDLPFLEIDEELWNPEMTRLTLFIDPGRIKRGVRPLEEIGPALEAGKAFTLVIDEAWRDARGNPLRETHRKSFKVTEADRQPPDPAQWIIVPPKSGTHEALVLTFPEPMDHALAGRLIRVIDRFDQLVGGKVTLGEEERRWTLIPDGEWSRGDHHIVIQTTIEDLAGNNIGKPFEVDLVEPVQRQLTRSSVRVPFVVN